MTEPAPSAPMLHAHPVDARPWLMGGITMLIWLYLFHPELKQLTELLRMLAPFNLMLLVGALMLLLAQGLRRRADWQFSLQPSFAGWPTGLLITTAIATLLSRTFLDLEHLSVVTLVVSLYGLLGLFCSPRAWRRSFPFVVGFAILMAFFALEFTDLGHLARTSVAEMVAVLLKPFHIKAITSEDVLVLSTGIAFVDVPCSGFKNIEIGSLFFMAASLLERKRMGLRWLVVGCANILLLITTNIARILILVILTFTLNQQALANSLHVPLGLSGFITVCLLTLYLLRFVPRQSVEAKGSGKSSCDRTGIPIATHRRNRVITLGLLLGLALWPTPTIATPTFEPLALPIASQTIALTAQEESFFNRYPGVDAQKQTFEYQGLSGSLLVVASPTWQAHHAPELCLASSGFTIDQMQRQVLAEDVTGRWLSLNQGQQQAAYWFQSPERTTDRYLDRVWSEMIRRDPQWTMVSILFNEPVSGDNPDVKTFLATVHDAIAASMA